MSNNIRNEIKHLKSEFAKIYSNKIRPNMVEYEKTRRNIIKKIALIECILLTITIVTFYFALSDFMSNKTLTNSSIFTIFIAIAFIVVGFSYFYIENKKFSKELKTKHKTDILEGFRELLKIYWTNNQTISKTELEMSGLFANFDCLDTDDCFKGTYKEVDYAIQECTLTQNNSAWWLAFKGAVVKFSSNKKFKGNTLVSTKQDFNIQNIDIGTFLVSILFLGLGGYITWIIFSHIFEEITIYGNTDKTLIMLGLELLVIPAVAIGCIIWIYKKKLSLKKTELEDIEFEKKYTVKTTDEIEARYLLTTSFMERLKNIQTAFNTNQIKCSFSDKNLIIAIPTNKNIFEIGNLLTPLDDAKTFDIFFNELTSLLILIDYFKLNEQTGL